MCGYVLKTLFLGLCLCVDFLVVFGQRVRDTSGSSGVVCEDGFRKCVTRRATCINGTCRCNAGVEWKGNFACYSPSAYHTEIINDPSLKTFARDSVSLPVSCRYLVSHFRTNFTPVVNSTCEVVVHAFNLKRLGKFVVHGFDLALEIKTPLWRNLTESVSFREYGTAFRGKYTFTGYGAHAFRPDGPWDSPEQLLAIFMPETVVRLRHDPYNNFGYTEVENCGFSLRFRPFDSALGKDQTQVPGLALSVDPLHSPEWLSLDKVMSLVPNGEPRLRTITEETDLSPDNAMLLRFAQAGVIQNQPNAAPECTAFSQVVTSCGDKDRRNCAFHTCQFILNVARLIKCFDRSENGNTILNLYLRCFQMVCFEDQSACSEIKEEVATCSSASSVPEVGVFLHPRTCFFCKV